MQLDPRALRRCILQAAASAKEGHLGSAFSILDILWVLYADVLRINPHLPDDDLRDRFFLSKGHAAIGLYAILMARGFFDHDTLMGFCSKNSVLGGHPDCRKVPGVEATTGSLGHGMPIAVGVAMALKLKASASHVYCLIGDGESNEGTIWESALLASHHHLDNVTCIMDHNHSGDRALNIGGILDKFRAFGWETAEIDGHDHASIRAALVTKNRTGPRFILANTIKGKGCPEMENNPAWHHRIPTPKELEELLANLS
jgi:transketolase